MAQAQTTTTTETTETNGKGKREPKTLTPADAVKKIEGILELLTTSGRKRVLAFINAGDDTDDGSDAAE